MIDPILLESTTLILLGLSAVLAGIVIGYIIGRLIQRRKVEQEPLKPICDPRLHRLVYRWGTDPKTDWRLKYIINHWDKMTEEGKNLLDILSEQMVSGR
jgi:uncharacterized protein YneF (UPF0154 family)